MKPHAKWINDVMSDEQYQKEYETAVQTLPNGVVVTHPDNYRPEYDEVVYNIMSNDYATITHCCVVLHCTKNTIQNWIKRHPSFRDAINAGRMNGEVAFRKRLEDHAFEPSSTVNNGLIKLLAKNIHNIDDVTPQVVINNNTQNNVIVKGEESAQLFKDAIDAEVIEVDSEEDGWAE